MASKAWGALAAAAVIGGGTLAYARVEAASYRLRRREVAVLGVQLITL